MKYEMTDETVTLKSGEVLYRIRALKDFSDVRAGDLGGYIQWPSNLSQEGDCWIYPWAFVYGKDSYDQIRGSVRVGQKARCY